MKKDMNWLCKIGWHDEWTIINAYENKAIHSGAVLGCRRCNKVWKWGNAIIPNYIKQDKQYWFQDDTIKTTERKE